MQIAFLWLLSTALSLAANHAAAEDEVAAVVKVPFTLKATGTTDLEPEFSGVLQIDRNSPSWRPEQEAQFSFARIREAHAKWRSDSELRTGVTFECLGPKDPSRVICLETRALDKSGHLLAHDWQVEGDNRIGPAEVPMGSLMGIRSRLNSTGNTLKLRSLGLDRLEFRLIEFKKGLPRHFPSRPHKLDLRVTQPQRNGSFDVHFSNPRGWNLEPSKHQVAFQLFVRDKHGKLIRADRRFLQYHERGECRQAVCVERKYYPYSTISLTIFTRQPDNDKFIREFFLGGGSAYRGIWTGDGGKLVELPLIGGATPFEDLPAKSKLVAAKFTNTRQK